MYSFQTNCHNSVSKGFFYVKDKVVLDSFSDFRKTEREEIENGNKR